jgi:L,D-transpeptidase catalytic domain
VSNLNGKSADRSDRPQHTEIEGLLAAYVAGELDEEMEQVVVERHIINCAICQQTIVETSRVFTLLSTLAHSDTHASNLSVVKQPSSLADAVLAQLAQGKPVDDNETIEAIARPLSSFPGVIRLERDNDVLTDNTEEHSLFPWLRKHEPQIQQEGGRNMNSILVPTSGHNKSRRDKSGPYTWFTTIAATILVLFVIGGSLTILVRMVQHNTNHLYPSSETSSSPIVSISPTAAQNVRLLAHNLVKQFHQEVAIWGAAHLYHDSFDGHDYQLDSAYMQAGLGDTLDNELAQAQTDADFRGVVDEANKALFSLHMLEADAGDSSPFNQPHHSDLQLLNQYHLQGQVMVVSLAGQAMRVYQNGKLVKAFRVTTGQPSFPVVTKELFRESNVTFKAPVPKGNPNWFPDTHVNYAIKYHTGGYYLYDAWWQSDFGPGTQFPHHDTRGNLVQSINGGIGFNENDAAWVYNNTNLDTTIVVY